MMKSDGVLGGAIGVNVKFDLSWCGVEIYLFGKIVF